MWPLDLTVVSGKKIICVEVCALNFFPFPQNSVSDCSRNTFSILTSKLLDGQHNISKNSIHYIFPKSRCVKLVH